MENKEKQMIVKGMVMIRVVYVCVIGVLLINIANPAFEWFALRKQRGMQYQAQEETQEMLREQRRILEETLKVFAEISKERAAAIPANPPDSAVGMETDSAQETAGMNPDAIDSVPCCGALTELPPLLEMAMGKTSGNAETELAERLPEDAPVEGALEHELEKIIEQMPEGARVKMQHYLYQMKAFEAGLGESDLAELDRMKDGIRAQFKAQEAMFMPERVEWELAEEEQIAREKGREKKAHFRAVSHLMMQKRKAAIERRIQESRQMIQNIVSTPEERERQEAIQAVTDLAFPPND